MKSKQIFFFATKEDLLQLVQFIESNFNIQYAEAGLLDQKTICIPSLHKNVENNHIEYGDWNFNKIFIILPIDKSLQVREIPQRAGGVKYAIDQMKNEESVEIFLGGKYKEEAIIASKIATISQTEFAKNIMKHLSIYFRNNFKNIEGFYLSSKAFDEAQKGMRLTTNSGSPVEYDLQIGDLKLFK